MRYGIIPEISTLEELAKELNRALTRKMTQMVSLGDSVISPRKGGKGWAKLDLVYQGQQLGTLTLMESEMYPGEEGYTWFKFPRDGGGLPLKLYPWGDFSGEVKMASKSTLCWNIKYALTTAFPLRFQGVLYDEMQLQWMAKEDPLAIVGRAVGADHVYPSEDAIFLPGLGKLFLNSGELKTPLESSRMILTAGNYEMWARQIKKAVRMWRKYQS